MIKVIIDSKYCRHQFDDYLAGGKVEYRGKIYYWLAQDSNYGFGWEVEPITEEDWKDITEKEYSRITGIVEKFLCEHKTKYTI